MTGQTVHHYRIGERLGAGGMGVVYKAEDSRLGRSVAIKFLSDETPRGISLSRFTHEAKTASSLNHPHICTVHDIGEFEGRPYIVMELLEGQPLDELLETPIDVKQTVSFALQIAEALEAAHAKGVIHRDIKPANIFVTTQGSVKLLDFGIAKQVQSDTETLNASTLLTQAGTALGTVSYMSPEQALGEPLDHRTDFFSLGVVLYQMTTAEKPFDAATAAAVVDSIVHREPEKLARGHSEFPTGLRGVVKKLLQKNPDKRYQSAAGLIRDLRQLGKDLDRPDWVQWMRPKGRWIAAGLALVLLAGLAWTQAPLKSWMEGISDWAGVQISETTPGRPIVAVTRLISLGGGPGTDEIGLGIAYSLATSLATVPSVTVISPAATLKEPGEKEALDVARDWGADFVISGAVLRAGDRLRVDINLLKGSSAVWGGQIEGDAGDLFGVQKKLVNRLTGALQLVLSDKDRNRLNVPPTRNKEAYADYTQGRAFLERLEAEEDLNRAISLFKAAQKKDEDFSLAYAALGEAYWAKYERTKDPNWTEKARSQIEKAVQLDPDQAAVRRSLALIYKGTGQLEKALNELRRAQDLQPNDDEVHRLRGEVLAAQGKTAEAIEAYQQAIDLRPNFWGNHRALGMVYFRKGLYREAAKHFKRVTELQPDLFSGFHYLGVTYHAAGNLELAKQNYQKALELGPSAGAYANLGTICYRQGDYSAAARYYEESLRLQPASETTLRNLGDAYQKLSDQERAREAYIRGLELVRDQLRVNSRDPQLLAMAGLLEAKLGRHQEAARHADQALAEDPDNGQLCYRRAVVHALAGEYDAALSLLKRAVAAGYSGSEAAQDDDLSGLRKRSDFQAFISGRQ